MVGWILLSLSVFFVFIGKSVADIVSNEPNWKKSIFSKYPIDSFWGSKDHTWVRKYKYKDNKILNYLFTTILVWTTDIWHLSNTIRRVGIYMGITGSLFIDNLSNSMIFIIVGLYIIINVIGFHIFYTKILRNEK